MSNEFLRNFDWDSFDAATYNDEMARKLEPFFERFFMTKTKDAAFRGGAEDAVSAGAGKYGRTIFSKSPTGGQEFLGGS